MIRASMQQLAWYTTLTQIRKFFVLKNMFDKIIKIECMVYGTVRQILKSFNDEFIQHIYDFS